MSIQAIPSYSARRSLFEHFVKTRAEEERKEKRAAQKAAIEGFKQLLDEASEVLHCLNLKLICTCYCFLSNLSTFNLWNYCMLIYHLIFRILITIAIIRLSERNGEMTRGLRHWTARNGSSY